MPQYAGVDLGSNSFHMVLGQTDGGGRVTFVDRVKEYVRLAGGLGPDRILDEAAIERALDCLSRFGERLRDLDPDNVRVVGTNTLRKARNAEQFVDAAETLLGKRIDIISGLEEARLVYRGVAASFDRKGSRLVVDIGGGSTEIILGDEDEPKRLDSLYLGCVSWTKRFFPDGQLTPGRFAEAELAARREISPVSRLYREKFEHAVGSSGTARALDRVLLATGLGTEGITPHALELLKERLMEFGTADAISMPEISSERAQVLPGGLAIMAGVLRGLHVDRMTTVDTALREGIILDLVGRAVTGDVHLRTITRMQERFGVDRDHADRVSRTAMMLFNQVEQSWSLPEGSRELLLWSVQLHEIGLFLRYASYHRHGSYLVKNADLPGFSRQDQRAIAALVLGHRGRFDMARLERLRPKRAVPAELVLLIRLAVRLHRTRTTTRRPDITARATAGRLDLEFPEGWLAERPLSARDLVEEREQAQKAGLTLSFR